MLEAGNEKSPQTIDSTVGDAVPSDIDILYVENGHQVLNPPFPEDPEHSLRWSWMKKHQVLLSMLLPALLTDFGMTYGSVLFQAQAPDFGMSVTAVSNSVSGGLFMQGPGGLLSVPLIQRWGRLPVLFWSQLLSALMVIAAALSPNYGCFTAFRTLQGFVNTAPQVVGLSVVHDMFYMHERPRKINVWVVCILGGPFLGPFLASWLIEVLSWRAVFGVLAGLHGFALLVLVLLGDETLSDQGRSRVKGNRVKSLIGLVAVPEDRPRVYTVLKDVIAIQFRPQILFITAIYVMVQVAWVIGINVTFSQLVRAPPYSFNQTDEALSWIAPMIGALFGELSGHYLNDWICNLYVQSHDGKYKIENRLWGAYIPFILGCTGLILYGQTLEHVYHWILLLVAWAFVVFAMIATTTVVSTYALECFPDHAALAASIINFWRTTGGFCVVYFQFKWIASSGAANAFGCQAGILAFAFLAGIVTTQIFGRSWRMKYPPPKAEN